MQFYRFQKAKNDKYCVFEEFKGRERCICGKPSYGQIGTGMKSKPLCEEHFYYVLSLNGKDKFDDVKVLTDKNKETGNRQQ